MAFESVPYVALAARGTGSAIAPFEKASVTVRNVYQGTPSIITMGDVGHPVDLRDENGQLVATLDDRGPAFATASVLSGMVQVDEGKLSTVADAELRQRIIGLVAAIRDRGEAGERAARSIITELGD